VNTRLQVEHGVTELITGLDIVGLMIDVVEGKELSLKQDKIHMNRWALEVRVNAEDPKTFSPSFGTISRLQVPTGPGVRVANGVYEGADIPPYYDSLIMLLMTSGRTRDGAIKVMDKPRISHLHILRPKQSGHQFVNHKRVLCGNQLCLLVKKTVTKKFYNLVRAIT